MFDVAKQTKRHFDCPALLKGIKIFVLTFKPLKTVFIFKISAHLKTREVAHKKGFCICVSVLFSFPRIIYRLIINFGDDKRTNEPDLFLCLFISK